MPGPTIGVAVAVKAKWLVLAVSVLGGCDSGNGTGRDAGQRRRQRRSSGNRWWQQWRRVRGGGLGWRRRPRWFGRRHERWRRPCRFGRCARLEVHPAMPAEEAREPAARLGNKLGGGGSAGTGSAGSGGGPGGAGGQGTGGTVGSGGKAGSAGAGGGGGGVSGTGGVTGSGGTAGAGGAAGASACGSTCTIDSLRCGPLTQILSCQAQSDGCSSSPATKTCATEEACQRLPVPACFDPRWAQWIVPNCAVDVAKGAPHPTHYTDVGDGTVIDDVTHLMWQKTIDGANTSPPPRYSWPKALGYCGFLRLAGYDDWRLPSAVDSSRSSITDVPNHRSTRRSFPIRRQAHSGRRPQWSIQ